MGISDATVATAIQGAECQANSRRLSARRGNISLDIPFYRTTYDHRSLKTQDLDAFDLDATWTLFGRFMRFGRYPDATFTFGNHIAPRARARSLPPLEIRLQQSCSDRFWKSPYRRSCPTSPVAGRELEWVWRCGESAGAMWSRFHVTTPRPTVGTCGYAVTDGACPRDDAIPDQPR